MKFQDSLTEEEEVAIYNLYFSKDWKKLLSVFGKLIDSDLMKVARLNFYNKNSRILGSYLQGQIRRIEWLTKNFKKIALIYEKNLSKKKT